NSAFFQQILESLATHFGIDLFLPWNKLPEETRKLVMEGSGETEIEFTFDKNGRKHSFKKEFEGVVPTCSGGSRNTSGAGASRGGRPTTTSRRSTTSSTGTCRTRSARSA